MKLFWKDSDSESILCCEPVAKLCSLKLEEGKFRFVCLGQNYFLQVYTLNEAKSLAQTRLQAMLLEIQEALNRRTLPSQP